MVRGDKSAYTDKQKRKAEHIEEGYEHRGVGKDGRAARLGDGEQGKRRRQEKRIGPRQDRNACLLAQGRQARRRSGGRRPAAKRSASARKAAATRKRRASG
jgi:hypothetical protein